jgi:hypothetical protein
MFSECRIVPKVLENTGRGIYNGASAEGTYTIMYSPYHIFQHLGHYTTLTKHVTFGLKRK